MVLTSLGNLYLRIRKYNEALEYLEKAKDISKETKDQIGLAMIHFSISKCLLSKGENRKGIFQRRGWC